MANCLEYNLFPKYLEFDNSIFEKKKLKKNWRKAQKSYKYLIKCQKTYNFIKLTLCFVG